jgi:hypothetical protein
MEQGEKLDLPRLRIPAPSQQRGTRAAPKGFVRRGAGVLAMLMMRERRPAFRTLEGWARSVLLEAGAVHECEEHGWARDRTDSHARDRAVLIARQDPPPASLGTGCRRCSQCGGYDRRHLPGVLAPRNEHSIREGFAPSLGRSPAPPRPCPCPARCRVLRRKRKPVAVGRPRFGKKRCSIQANRFKPWPAEA